MDMCKHIRDDPFNTTVATTMRSTADGYRMLVCLDCADFVREVIPTFMHIRLDGTLPQGA